jgi:hypothetical protein
MREQGTEKNRGKGQIFYTYTYADYNRMERERLARDKKKAEQSKLPVKTILRKKQK